MEARQFISGNSFASTSKGLAILGATQLNCRVSASLPQDCGDEQQNGPQQISPPSQHPSPAQQVESGGQQPANGSTPGQQVDLGRVRNEHRLRHRMG